MLKNILKLNEPIWGEKIMIAMNDLVSKNYILSKLVPFTADIFVFTYPVYLTVLYLYGTYRKNVDFKNGALYIFFSAAGSTAFNLFVQYFIDKSRPELAITNKNNLILEHLPTKPFPSDHAAVSAAVAMSTLLWGIKTKNKNLVRLSIVFWIFSIVMSLSRVSTGVHWLTDVIAGSLVGIIFSFIFINNIIYSFLSKKVFVHIINLEKYLFDKIFQIKQ
ncbi:MAG: phosphatase PAP2 family protein [Candidatus Absconditabacteria bacterium]